MSRTRRNNPQFLGSLASEIAALMDSDEAILGFVRAKVLEWTSDVVRAIETRDKRQQEEVARYLCQIAIVQERRGWCYTQWAFPSKHSSRRWTIWSGHDANGEKITVAGFVPKRFIDEENHKYYLPLPLPDSRKLTILEEYAVLSAIRDRAGKLGQIAPFAGLDEHDVLEAWIYESLKDDVVLIEETDEQNLWKMLARVKDDLRSNGIIEGDRPPNPSNPAVDPQKEPAPAPPALISDDAHLSAASLATAFRVPQNALEQRLKRFRASNADGWVEDEERKPRQPGFLYRMGTIRPIIDAMMATDEATDERPTKTSSR